MEVPVESSVSVCTMKIPMGDIRGTDLAGVCIANAALGGDFNSMLMKYVRVEKGLTYSASSSLRLSPMHLHITSTFSPDKANEGLQAIKHVVNEWKDFSQEQFEYGKRTLSMRMKSLVDIPSYSVHHDALLQHIGNTPEEWEATVNAATYEDVKNAFQHVHFHNSATVLSVCDSYRKSK